MTLRRRSLLAAAGLWACGAAAAPNAPPELAADLPAAQLQGSGRMRFFGLLVYDARLWADKPVPAADWAAAPFALELEYARGLNGEQIAERSLVEMKRQGEIAADTARRWLATMKTIFPDVKEGDRITGLNLPGKAARFFVNGSLRGEVPEPDFARAFFGIWLSPRSSEPALRQALLGQTS